MRDTSDSTANILLDYKTKIIWLTMFENEITKRRKRPGILQYGITNDNWCYIKIIR
jgi:hypothetical protein